MRRLSTRRQLWVALLIWLSRRSAKHLLRGDNGVAPSCTISHDFKYCFVMSVCMVLECETYLMFFEVIEADLTY